jgi:hypothetical protein
VGRAKEDSWILFLGSLKSEGVLVPGEEHSPLPVSYLLFNLCTS